MIKVLLTPNAGAGATPVSAGDAVGIFVKASELVESQMHASLDRAFLDEQGEVTRVVLQEGSEEPFGGLIDSLQGTNKNDVLLLCIPPSIAMGGAGSRSSRSAPDAWILAEVTVAKVKSKKAEKATTAKDHVPFQQTNASDHSDEAAPGASNDVTVPVVFLPIRSCYSRQFPSFLR